MNDAPPDTMSPEGQRSRPRPPPNRRRDKAQLSCHACRRRKLKCDRQQPCGTCSTRGQSHSCTYPAILPAGSVAEPIVRHAPLASSSDIRGRLNDLESQVLNLMHNSGAATESVRKDVPSITPLPNAGVRRSDKTTLPVQTDSESGTLHCSPAGTVYAGGAHWTAILDSISEMKGYFDQQEESGEATPVTCNAAPYTSDAPQLLLGGHSPVTKEEILAAMPERTTVDRLVFYYFNALVMPPNIACMHAGTFLRQYEAFWKSPSDTPLIWLGLLYSIMCLSKQFHPKADVPSYMDPAEAQEAQPQYLEEVIQCLVLGDYSRGGPHVIEALIHYFVIEHFRRPDTETGMWLLMGLILRLALRMGYHKDPSAFPELSVCQAEIRRRTWATLYSADVMLSLQVGVPRMITQGQWDTQPPRNLLDSDFDENTQELPPSRPDHDVTPMLFAIARQKMSVVIGMIADMTNSNRQDITETKRVEQLLETTYASIPAALKFTTLSNCLADSSMHILLRMTLASIYHKAKIILNWQQINASSRLSDKTDLEKSRQTCINSALKILEYQELTDAETQPGGTLYAMKWKLSSTAAHESLVAATVLCTYLYRNMGPQPIHSMDERELADITKALRRSYEVLVKSRARSKEAKKVTDMITLVFMKLNIPLSNRQPQNNAISRPSSGTGSGAPSIPLFSQESSLYGMQMMSSGYDQFPESPLKAMNGGSDILQNSFSGNTDPAYLMLGLGLNWNWSPPS